jgi:pimeloyl-ACP methyl ester carboxylesterase
MTTVPSQDGTRVAFEKSGEGPPIILIDGALCYRGYGPSRPLAAQLSRRFTVFTYDRRGRGDSGDSPPYAVEREVEDIEALVEEAGGSVHLCGFSSGAALALEAAQRGAGVDRLALYEAPFIVDDSRPRFPPDYRAQLETFVESDRRGDAVRLFMRQVGLPRVLIALMRFTPAWRKATGVAHTLPYDAAVMADTQAGKPLPADRWADVQAPTLALVGGKSGAWMHNGMRALANNLPNAQFQVLDGQTHMVKPRVLAPVLMGFFSGGGAVGSGEDDLTHRVVS